MLRRDGHMVVRVAVALVLAFLIGYLLTKAVAPLNSAFLDSLAFFVAITVGFLLGDATRRRPPKR